MKYVSHAKCMICGKRFEKSEFDYICPDHGNEGILDIQYDYDAIKKAFTKKKLAANKDLSIWRYKPLLPVDENSQVPNLSVGNTPLLKLEALADELGVSRLYLKDDGRLPTASFKDRASAIAVVKAREAGVQVVTTASTGNAAAALSGLCASMGQENIIFVPASAPQAKIAQLLMFGSKVILVDGTYDDAFELCLEAAQEYGWYNRNTGYNPYMSEGKKTCAFEICEQLDWKAPDVIFVSVGDGCIIGGIHKGLKDLFHLGWIDKIPRLMGVQAEGSSYLYQAWKNNENIVTKPGINASTIADSISAGLPRDRIKALDAVKFTKGEFIMVSDEEIIKAIPDLARKTGVFAEPAGAATWAGVKKAVQNKILKAHDQVVVINTGSGLKDINAAMKAVEQTNMQYYTVEPSMDHFREHFKKIASDLKL
ncbi:MAG: threonine synthase [Desulfobacteraceae bacterium 4572_89]|nr:MAG: threonine synthase [Desulfobacteraceae bacterium 4572_89]